jgi:hypothetical protein
VLCKFAVLRCVILLVVVVAYFTSRTATQPVMLRHAETLCACGCVLFLFQLPSVRPHFLNPVQSIISNTIYRLFTSLSFLFWRCAIYFFTLVSHTTQNSSSSRDVCMIYRQSIHQRFFLFFFLSFLLPSHNFFSHSSLSMFIVKQQ